MLCWFSDSFSLVPIAIWKVSVKICGMGITGFIGPIGPSPAKNEAWHHTLGQEWFTICASIYSTHAPKAIFLLLQFLPSTTWGVVPFPLLCSEAALEDAPSGPNSPDVPDASMIVEPDGSQDDAVAEGGLGENRASEPDIWLQVWFMHSYFHILYYMIYVDISYLYLYISMS